MLSISSSARHQLFLCVAHHVSIPRARAPSNPPLSPLSLRVCQHSGESSFRLPLSNRLVSRSRRLADRHPGAAGGRRRGDPLGLPGGPDFPLQGDAEAPLPHRGRVALHRRYVFVSLSVTLLPKVVKKKKNIRTCPAPVWTLIRCA